LIADQIKGTDKRVEVLANGDRVIVDHELTVRRVYSIFYWCANVGSLSGLASVTMEKYLGFWTSFLLSFGSLIFGASILVLGKNRYCKSVS
jgi:proton-dependent oligopeptide transporter, POT family